MSWLSNFPDENEVLYMNTSFQICNIYPSSANMPMADPSFLGNNEFGSMSEEMLMVRMERGILNAMQTINVDTKIISLNENDGNGGSHFGALGKYEKLCVLYLLCLQYKREWWTQAAANDNEHNFLKAIIKFKHQSP